MKPSFEHRKTVLGLVTWRCMSCSLHPNHKIALVILLCTLGCYEAKPKYLAFTVANVKLFTYALVYLRKHTKKKKREAHDYLQMFG